MDIETHHVKLIHRSGRTASGTFCYDDEAEDCTLTLQSPEGDFEATESDYFEALSTIRRSLETKGWLLACYGGSKNVFPSGMGRDMGRGLQAYRVLLGQHAKMSDLVDIFAEGEDMEPATVDEQAEFFERWLESLRKRK